MPSLVDTHEIDGIDISAEAHAEITRVLLALGRDSRFHPSDRGVLIDMTGLGLIVYQPDLGLNLFAPRQAL